MPLLETKGAASAQGFGEFAKVGAANYIEDVFSTYLYTGNGSTQTITNGIDLSTKGGLVWLKSRSAVASHMLIDTARGSDQTLTSNGTGAQSNNPNRISGFNANGFGLGNDSVTNTNAVTYVSWTFEKQAKFFDVVTYTGNGSSSNVINHSLGTTVGCAIIKCTSNGSTNWIVYHRSMLSDNVLKLNTTDAQSSNASFSSTSTTFTVRNFNTVADNTNESGYTYVAYLFAHNAGGFGLTGTDNVISCGSFTTDGSGYIPAVTLGYEPQLLLFKASSTTGNWAIWDTMRGFSQTSDLNLSPNTSAAESDFGSVIEPTATGFQNGDGAGFNPSVTYIYIAIRRGPMKTPTTGTSVFTPDSSSAAGNQTITAGFPTDMLWQKSKPNVGDWYAGTRLQGNAIWLNQNSTAAETNFSSIDPTALVFTNAQNSVSTNLTGSPISYAFRRAPSFFDVVCYTGTGSATTVAHNLGVVPELMIVKSRSSGIYDWRAYSSAIGATKYLKPNGDSAEATSSAVWNDTTPTSSVFTVGSNATVNASGGTYVAYLFASCPGVSKVGSYTGTGTTKQIDCGFTGGARFVLIKRTDSTGDWYCWDSSRGIVSGNDPYLLLNSTAAEVTNTDYIDTYSAGFEISSTAPAAINANGGSFVFLAIS